MNEKVDNPALEEFCHTVIDLLSAQVCKYVPEATENMRKHLAPATECQLGFKHPKLFPGLTFVCDYCAHGHVDRNDYPLGTNAILSLQNPEKRGKQLHCLANYSLTEDGPQGMQFDLGNGSVCFENAALEVHSSSRVETPDKKNPSRIGIIAYLHSAINKPNHGEEEGKKFLKKGKLTCETGKKWKSRKNETDLEDLPLNVRFTPKTTKQVKRKSKGKTSVNKKKKTDLDCLFQNFQQ
jgi:hypothetical protein